MISCAECRRLLDAFLGGALGASEDDSVREHLDSCRGCGERLLASGRLALRLPAGEHSFSPHFNQRLLARFPDAPQGWALSRWFWAVVAAASAVAVLIYVLITRLLSALSLDPRGIPRAKSELQTHLLDLWQQLSSNSLIRLCFWSAAALLFSLIVIAVVDSFSHRRSESLPVAKVTSE